MWRRVHPGHHKQVLTDIAKISALDRFILAVGRGLGFNQPVSVGGLMHSFPQYETKTRCRILDQMTWLAPLAVAFLALPAAVVSAAQPDADNLVDQLRSGGHDFSANRFEVALPRLWRS